MARRARKGPVCARGKHVTAPHGPKGKCPACGVARCHGKNRDGTRCRLSPIRLALVCRAHGAAKGTKGRAAADAKVQEAKSKAAVSKLFGRAVVNVDYREALVNELAFTHTLVASYRSEISGLPGLTSTTERGETAHALIVLHDRAQDHLLKVIRACHEARIDQQMLDLARTHADQMDRMIHALLRGLGHDPQDPEVRQIVRTMLTVIDGGAA